MYNKIKYHLKWLLTDFFEKCLSVRTFRNLFQTSNFLVSYEKLVPILGLVSKSPEALRTPISEVAHLSHSQYAQDLFVLSALKFKKNGFFVGLRRSKDPARESAATFFALC